MKLKKVASLCAKKKIFKLFDQTDDNGEVVVQWLSDGGAAYPLYGLPYLDEDGLFGIFDISEKAREKIFFQNQAIPGSIDVSDFAAGEVEAFDMGVTISSGGRVLMPLRYSGGIVFINDQYLDPLVDQADYLKLYVRKIASGGHFVAAKTGMLISAVIFPVRITDGDFVEAMEDVASWSRRELEKNSAAEVKDHEREGG